MRKNTYFLYKPDCEQYFGILETDAEERIFGKLIKEWTIKEDIKDETEIYLNGLIRFVRLKGFWVKPIRATSHFTIFPIKRQDTKTENENSRRNMSFFERYPFNSHNLGVYPEITDETEPIGTATENSRIDDNNNLYIEFNPD